LAKDPDNLANDLGAESTGGLFTGLLAEEDEFDRRTRWRLGSWGFAAVGAVTLAILANQSSLGWRRDRVAAAEVARQMQQIQVLTKESQNEARQLASAIETLNSDRDRLYARVTVLEQGLDSVTGSIAKRSTAASPQPVPSPYPAWVQEPAAQPASAPAPVVAPVVATTSAPAPPEKPAAERPPVQASDTPPAVASDKPPAEKPPVVAAEAAPAATVPSGNPDPASAAAALLPAMPLVTAKSTVGPPNPAASKPVEPAKAVATVTASPMPEVVAAAPAAGRGERANEDATAPNAEVQHTEFGVDLGTANSLPGLRALWRGLLKSRSNAPLFDLRPIIVIKEGANGLGMQLRLVAGPLRDAGAAAKICAVLAENGRPCETAVFDGQRLTLKDEPPAAMTAPTKPAPRRHVAPKRAAAPVVVEEPPKASEPASAVSTITSLFGRKEQ
jgi:hypothetical protein